MRRALCNCPVCQPPALKARTEEPPPWPRVALGWLSLAAMFLGGYLCGLAVGGHVP